MTPTDKPIVEGEVPLWISKMHEHRAETGFYRAEDMQRVLGEPSQGAEAPATDDMPKHGRWSIAGK